MEKKEKHETGQKSGIVQHILKQCKTVLSKVSLGSDKLSDRSGERRFVSVISWLQLFLGFLCVCCSVAGIGAIYEAKLGATRRTAEEFIMNTPHGYMRYADHVKRAQRKMIAGFGVALRYMERHNCTQPPGQYLRRIQEIGRQSIQEEPPYIGEPCLYDDCIEVQLQEQWYRLTLERLFIPSWTGIMLIITSLVGFRAVTQWNYDFGMKSAYTHNIMNLLCLFIFGPLVMTAACLQINFADGSMPFRAALGRVTGVFAGMVLLASLIAVVTYFHCDGWCGQRKAAVQDEARNLNKKSEPVAGVVVA